MVRRSTLRESNDKGNTGCCSMTGSEVLCRVAPSRAPAPAVKADPDTDAEEASAVGGAAVEGSGVSKPAKVGSLCGE